MQQAGDDDFFLVPGIQRVLRALQQVAIGHLRKAQVEEIQQLRRLRHPRQGRVVAHHEHRVRLAELGPQGRLGAVRGECRWSRRSAGRSLGGDRPPRRRAARGPSSSSRGSARCPGDPAGTPRRRDRFGHLIDGHGGSSAIDSRTSSGTARVESASLPHRPRGQVSLDVRPIGRLPPRRSGDGEITFVVPPPAALGQYDGGARVTVHRDTAEAHGAHVHTQASDRACVTRGPRHIGPRTHPGAARPWTVETGSAERAGRCCASGSLPVPGGAARGARRARRPARRGTPRRGHRRVPQRGGGDRQVPDGSGGVCARRRSRASCGRRAGRVRGELGAAASVRRGHAGPRPPPRAARPQRARAVRRCGGAAGSRMGHRRTDGVGAGARRGAAGLSGSSRRGLRGRTRGSALGRPRDACRAGVPRRPHRRHRCAAARHAAQRRGRPGVGRSRRAGGRGSALPMPLTALDDAAIAEMVRACDPTRGRRRGRPGRRRG